jgi:hypothetical protein
VVVPTTKGSSAIIPTLKVRVRNPECLPQRLAIRTTRIVAHGISCSIILHRSGDKLRVAEVIQDMDFGPTITKQTKLAGVISASFRSFVDDEIAQWLVKLKS